MIYYICLKLKEDPLMFNDPEEEFIDPVELLPDVIFENYFEEKKKKKAIRYALKFAHEVAMYEGLAVEIDIVMAGPKWTGETQAMRRLNDYEYDTYMPRFNHICEHSKKRKNYSFDHHLPW